MMDMSLNGTVFLANGSLITDAKTNLFQQQWGPRNLGLGGFNSRSPELEPPQPPTTTQNIGRISCLYGPCRCNPSDNHNRMLQQILKRQRICGSFERQKLVGFFWGGVHKMDGHGSVWKTGGQGLNQIRFP